MAPNTPVYRVILSPQARRDVQETADYLAAQTDLERARIWKNGVLEAIGSLAQMPMRCAVAGESQELGVELHQLMYRPHRILFRVDESAQRVNVLRVYHSARAPLQVDHLA